MFKKHLFFFFFASFLYSEIDFQSNSISNYKNLLTESDNLKQFYKDYLLSVRLLDTQINSIVAFYGPDELYRSYIYSRSTKITKISESSEPA